MTMLTLSCLSQSRFETGGAAGLVVIDQAPDSAYATGGQAYLNFTRVIDKDTLDDFFSALVGVEVGYMAWRNQSENSTSSSLYLSALLGFTPVDDVFFTTSLAYLPGLDAMRPSVRVQGRPFDKFIGNTTFTMYLEGGYIKYLKKPTSPTGYVSVGVGIIL